MKTPIYRISLLLLTACNAWAAPGPESYRETWRPQFHFTPAKNWMNDPNGMLFYQGEYHLFYQHNPFGDKWGHMSWGHAVTRDLLRWQHLPVALAEENDIMIFSGSAVVDRNNTSGFGRAGQPPLVAIYTGHSTKQPLQNQHIAYSNDRGRTWTKFSGNPVLDIGEKDFRDPKVFWHESTKRWIMTVSWPVQRKVRFYASPNLKEWTHLSDFGPAGSTHGIWECPDLFPLALGDRTQWVLIVNVGSGAPAGGSGGQYFVGDFDGTRFTLDGSFPKSASESALWLDYGPDFYAAVSWSDVPKRDGRRLAIGWMSNWQYANDVPTSPWRSAMSLPRELSLRDGAEGLRLQQLPVRETRSLRGRAYRLRNATVAEANAWLARQQVKGDRLEILAEFEGVTGAGALGVNLAGAGEEQTRIRCDAGRGLLSLDRTRSGRVDFHPVFARSYTCPVRVLDGTLSLQLFLDTSSVEVFPNQGEQAMTALILPEKGPLRPVLFADGNGARLRSLIIYELRRVWK